MGSRGYKQSKRKSKSATKTGATNKRIIKAKKNGFDELNTTKKRGQNNG